MTITTEEPQVYTRHDISSCFPEIKRNDGLNELVESMRRWGFIEDRPILLYEDQILDGWNRYNAARIAGVTPVFEIFTGSDAEANDLVERENAARRHLKPGDLAYALVRIDSVRPEAMRRTPEEIVSLTGSNIATVKNAFKFAEERPDIVEKVAAGDMSPTEAEREVLGKANKEKVGSPAVELPVRITPRFHSARTIAPGRTVKQALTEALALWCEARETGKRLVLADPE